MACPFFVPREVLNDGSWPHPSRLPLGAGWSGECCASNSILSPSDVQIREFCNLGYASRCPHLPVQRDWDAVRFSPVRVSEHEIVLKYVCELAHAPIEHGELVYDVAGERWLYRHADARVDRLATCYLQTYRARSAPVGIE